MAKAVGQQEELEGVCDQEQQEDWGCDVPKYFLCRSLLSFSSANLKDSFRIFILHSRSFMVLS